MAGLGSLYRLATGEFKGTPHDGTQAAFDALKALLSPLGGLMQVGPGMEGIVLGNTGWANIALVRITNAGRLGISGFELLKASDPAVVGPIDYDGIVYAFKGGIIQAHNAAAQRYRGDFNPTGTDLVIYAFDDVREARCLPGVHGVNTIGLFVAGAGGADVSATTIHAIETYFADANRWVFAHDLVVANLSAFDAYRLEAA